MGEATKGSFSIWHKIREFFMGSGKDSSIQEQKKGKETKQTKSRKRNRRQLEEEDSRTGKNMLLLRSRGNGQNEQNTEEKEKTEISAFKPVPVPDLQPLEQLSKFSGSYRKNNKKFKVIGGKLSKNAIRINPNSSSSFSSISSESEKEDAGKDIFKTPTSLQTVFSNGLGIVDVNVQRLKDTDNSRGPGSERKKMSSPLGMRTPSLDLSSKNSLESKFQMEHRPLPHPNSRQSFRAGEHDNTRTNSMNTPAKMKVILYSRPSSASKLYINYNNATTSSQESVSDKEEEQRPSISSNTKDKINGEEQLFVNDDVMTSSTLKGPHTDDLHNLNWPGKEVFLNTSKEILEPTSSVPKRRRNLRYDPARELNTNDIWSESSSKNSETLKRHRTLAEIMAEKFERLGNHFLGLFASNS